MNGICSSSSNCNKVADGVMIFDSNSSQDKCNLIQVEHIMKRMNTPAIVLATSTSMTALVGVGGN